MRKGITLFFLVMLAICVSNGQQTATVRGSICGLVLDENGLPAHNVRVVAILKPGPEGTSGGLPSSLTNPSGSYCIKGLQLGEYVLSAFDEAKGYPHRGPAFYSWQTPDPKVELTSDSPHARSNWQIPFKAGFVQIELPGINTEERSQPIRFSFHVRLRSDASVLSSELPVGFDGHSLRFLLPPDEEVMLRVTCADGQIWPEDSGTGKLLFVHAGEIEYISIPTACLSKQM